MKNDTKIPSDPLDIRYVNTGFMPHVGIHQRGNLFYHESSYSHFWTFGILFVSAVLFWLLPIEFEASFKPLKYLIPGLLIWMGICGCIPYWVRNAFGNKIVIDQRNQLLTIDHDNIEQKIPWSNIVEIQLCHHKVQGCSRLNGYQLNLVWRDGQGEIKRFCLMKHSVKCFVVSLGKRYSTLFQFKITDYTKESQPSSAP